MAQPMRPTRPTSLARAFAAVVALLLAFPNAARAIHHNVTLLGQYVVGQFTSASDGHGGTLIGDQPVGGQPDPQIVGLASLRQA